MLPCPAGYQEGYNGGCYRFVEGPSSWLEARADCQQTEDGDLAVINDAGEQGYFETAGGLMGDWWIGEIWIFMHKNDQTHVLQTCPHPPLCERLFIQKN